MKDKKKFYKNWKFWVIAFLVVGFMGALLGDDDESEKKKDPEVVDKENNKEEEVKNDKQPKIGESFTVGDVQYKILGTETKKKVGSEYINQEAKGIYYIVEVEITNNGKESLSVNDSFFILFKGDIQYEVDSLASMYSGDDSLWLEKLNPELTMKGKVAFDVSEDTAKSNDLELQVQTGFWGTQKQKVKLSK